MTYPIPDPILKGCVGPFADPRTGPVSGGAPAWSPASFDRLLANMSTNYVDVAGSANEWINDGGEWGNATSPSTGPVIVDPDADFATGKSIQFTDAAVNDLQIGTASTVKEAHDGTPVCLIWAYLTDDAADNSQSLGGSKIDSLAAQVGFGQRVQGGLGATITSVGNGSGTHLFSYTSTPGTFPANQVNVCGVFLGTTGAANQWEVWRASASVSPEMIAGGNFDGAPSTADAESAFKLGLRGGSASWRLDGKLGMFLAGTGYHMPDAMAYVRGLVI